MTKRFSRGLVEDVLQRVDIVNLIAERVSLRKTGKNYSGLCPFHQEKTPSFTVSPEKQFFYCFGCGASGNAVGFVMRHQNVPFPESVQQLALQVGVPLDPSWMFDSSPRETVHQAHYVLMEEVAEYYQQLLWKHPAALPARAYLSERGLTEATLHRFRLGFAPPGWDHLLKRFAPQRAPEQIQKLLDCGLLIQKEPGKVYDRFRERIIFPIADTKGRIVAFGGRTLGDGTPKYLNSPETEVFHKSQILYGLSDALKQARRPEEFCVVEGYMDVISLAQAGISGAVASMGTAFTQEHFKLLLRHTSRMTFCFDGDSAGRAAAWRALEHALPVLQENHHIRFLGLPEGEDPDTWIKKHSAYEWKTMLDQAQPLSQFFWQYLTSSINVETVEGRAQVLSKASTLIATLKSPLIRDLFLQQLSQRMNLTRLQVEQHFSRVVHDHPVKQSAPSVAFSKNQGLSAVKMALTLLVQHPELMTHIKVQYLSDFENMKALPSMPLLLQVISSLQEAPSKTTAQLLERFRDEPEENTLLQLAQWDHGLPEDGISTEFLGALSRLTDRNEGLLIDQLLKKASLGLLTQAEKEELQRRMREQKMGANS